MTLDELIAAAQLTVREAVILSELLRAKNYVASVPDMIDAIKRNIRVNPTYREQGTSKFSTRGKPMELNRHNIRHIINALNSKLLQANTGYAVVKTSGIGRGVHGIYQLRVPSSHIDEREHQHA
jgi:hypothetical protein